MLAESGRVLGMESPKMTGLALVGGRVLTLESDLPVAEAVAVEGMRVRQTGIAVE